MSERYFLRRWLLEAGVSGEPGVGTSDSRIAFSVRLQRGRPAVADVTVWSPARSLRDTLYRPGAVVRLSAGYADGGPVELVAGRIVQGSIEDQTATRAATLGFAVQPLAVKSSLISETATNATAGIRACASALGLVVEVLDVPAPATYARGVALRGNPLTALRTLVDDSGCQYAITDGRLRVWPLGQAARRTALVWSEDRELVRIVGPSGGGTDAGKVTAEALLSPALRPGDVVRVASRTWSGDVTAETVRHTGDSHGRAWYTAVEGVPRA